MCIPLCINKNISLKISLVGTTFPLNFLCGNAIPMRSRPTTPLLSHDYI